MFFLDTDCHGSLVVKSYFIFAALVFGFFFLEIIPSNCSRPPPLSSKPTTDCLCGSCPGRASPDLREAPGSNSCCFARWCLGWFSLAAYRASSGQQCGVIECIPGTASGRWAGGFQALLLSQFPLMSTNSSLCLKPAAVCGCITPCCMGAQHKEQSSHCTVLLLFSAHTSLATNDDSWQCLGLLQCTAQMH